MKTPQPPIPMLLKQKESLHVGSYKRSIEKGTEGRILTLKKVHVIENETSSASRWGFCVSSLHVFQMKFPFPKY